MKIISLRTKILAIVLAFLFLIGTAFVIYSMSITVNYKHLRLDSIERLVGYETEKVNKIISEMERSAIFFALGGKLVHEAGLEELGEILSVEYLNSFKIAVGGGFWYEPYAFRKDQSRAGFYAFYDKTIEKVLLDNTFFMDSYDYHTMDWYREIIDSITQPYQVVWTKPYVDDSGSFSLMTTAGSGVFNEDQKLIAISTVDWEIDEIIKQLLAINPTENSFVLLCVPEKDYVISSAYTNIFTGDSIKSIPWDIFANSFTLNSIKYLTFGRYMDNGWLLNIYIPENEIFAEVERRNTVYSILIALSSFIMLFIAYLIISAFINKPIKKLTLDVARIALGNLDTQIKTSSRDELGQLARTFSKMTRDLKNSIEENVREREEKKRISTELAVANEIQVSMLPNVFPPFPEKKEFDLYASMVPARNVGGDFYDFFLIDNDNLAVVIADVSGKGVPAALFMVISKTLIKYGGAGNNLYEVFESVNKKLCEGNEAGMFVTAFMGIYNIPTGRFIYVNAGHNPPLIKKSCKTFEFINTEPNTVLAFLEDSKYKQEEIILEKGDILYMYTDGVTEAMNNNKELFGENKLISTLNNCRCDTPKDILNVVKNEVDHFTDGAEQADDITMLALKINDNQETIKTLTITAAKENLNKVFEFINKELEKCEYSPLQTNEINIAVEEIFTNIANYAYEETIGTVKINISTNNQLKITFEDTGKPFNPLEHKDPDLNLSLEDRQIGGLGILMVKKIMETVTYTHQNNKNTLTITQNLPPATPPQ